MRAWPDDCAGNIRRFGNGQGPVRAWPNAATLLREGGWRAPPPGGAPPPPLP